MPPVILRCGSGPGCWMSTWSSWLSPQPAAPVRPRTRPPGKAHAPPPLAGQ